MTLEQAKKRRDQGDLIDELVAALEPLISYMALDQAADFAPLVAARAVIEKAKEHDCIPVDDVKEVHG